MPQPSLPARLAGARAAEIAAPAAIAVLLGVLLVTRPVAAAFLTGIVLVCGLVALAPRAMVVVYFIFVLIQALVLNFIADTHWSYLVVKRGDEVLLLILVILTAGRHAAVGIPAVKRSYLWLGAALGVGTISSLVHGGDLFPAALDVFLLVKGFLVFYVVLQLPIARGRPTAPLSAAMAVGCVALFAAAADFALGETYRALIHDSRPIEIRRGLGSIVSILGAPGMAGWFFAFSACIALAFWVVRRRPVHLVLCFAFSVASLLSLRRKPLVGLVVVFVLALLMSARAKSTLRTVTATLFIVGSVAYAAGGLVLGIFEDMLAQYVYAPEQMAIARNAMLKTSFQIASNYFPLGAGFGKFGGMVSAWYYSPLYYEYGLSSVHGLSEDQPWYLLDVYWPHLLGELGFIGTAFFICAMAFLVLPHLAAGSSSDPEVRIVRYAALFCFLEAIPESFGWVVFENSLAASWIFGLLALATIVTRLPRTTTSPEP